jgi:hypothetical protein
VVRAAVRLRRAAAALRRRRGCDVAGTATAVAIRLLPDDRLDIIAPCGLSDLFRPVLRRNPTRVSMEEFQRRYRGKRIRARWPRVQVIGG